MQSQSLAYNSKLVVWVSSRAGPYVLVSLTVLPSLGMPAVGKPPFVQCFQKPLRISNLLIMCLRHLSCIFVLSVLYDCPLGHRIVVLLIMHSCPSGHVHLSRRVWMRVCLIAHVFSKRSEVDL